MLLYGVVLTVLLPVVIIRTVGRVSRSLVVDGWGAAFLLVFAMTAVGWLLGLPMHAAGEAIVTTLVGSVPPVEPDSVWNARTGVVMALAFVSNTVQLFVLGLLLPGISVQGIVGILVAAALITLSTLALPVLMGVVG